MVEPINFENYAELKTKQELLYIELKKKYFHLISRTKLKKGRLRTFIATLTQLIEWNIIKDNIYEDSSHIDAFSEALDQSEKIVFQADLDSKLEEIRKIWQTEHKKRVIETQNLGLYKNKYNTNTKKFYDKTDKEPTVISLFSGAMGLDIGFIESGYRILIANDIDKVSLYTASKNIPEIKFINEDINKIPINLLMKEAGVDPGKVDLLIGGPPCQPFSLAGKRNGLNDPRSSPLIYFIKAISEIKPKAFVMEEVPGILSSRIKHFSYDDNHNHNPTPEEKRGSAFKVIMDMLYSTGYNITYRVLNTADYGVPQIRERVIFIGFRDKIPPFPKPTHSGYGKGDLLPWNTLWDAVRDLRHTHDINLPQKNKQYMEYIPPGGNWVDLPVVVAMEAMGGAYNSEGGKMGFFRRLAWDEPSPTLVTSPIQKGTYFIHPELDRPLTISEYKRLQGFPDEWVVVGNINDQYRLIGNAVPPPLAKAIAISIKRWL